jgi:hypothetical protein
LQELESLSQKQFVSPYCHAVIYAGLDKAKEVFHFLNKAIDEMSSWMIHLHFSTDPRFKEFKKDIRFTELLRRIQIVIE